MLTSLLNECINELKEIREIENLSNDSKKQEKVDNSFSAIVEQNNLLLNNLYLAYSKTNFIPSIEIKNSERNILMEIEKVIRFGMAKEGTNSLIANECKKLSSLISSEWNNFYADTSSGLLNLLETVIDITPDKTKTQQIINRIKKGSTWPSDENNLMLMQSGLYEGEKTINGMGLDNEIISFLKKVGDGCATLADFTTDILKWIEREQLSTKLSVNFKA